MERVLIVDDALDLGRLWQTALRAVFPDLNIMVVPSAEEALLEANYHKINLLLTDIRLPGMDGLELVGRIRRLHPEIKIILVTGQKDANYDDSVKALHVDAFFEKPFALEKLLTTVTGLMGLTPVPAGDFFSPQVPEALPEVPLKNRLSDILVTLRQELNALAVLLLDEKGKMMELTGELPMADFEAVWAPALLEAMRAGGAISRLLGKAQPENILAFRGANFDLMLLAPVGSYSLVSILKSGRTAVRPAVAYERTVLAQPELVQTLQEMGLELPQQKQASAPVETDEVQAEAGLEALLQQSSSDLQKQDVDTFWDSAPSVKLQISDDDILSYEEAKKRGLAPKRD